ncbi:hypothetical protein ACFYWS_13085 [Streptomyces sp. NPDC002795]|uniref:hypothetical protein n=1 Tax=Streptomyces sp. NPDC002795 TaxID=3364665 RepID=UPI0036C7EF86
MHAIRGASAVVLSLSALTLTAPSAHASDSDSGSFRPSVSPTTIAAGGKVTLSARGCDKVTRVKAAVFEKAEIYPGDGPETRTVDWDAEQGSVYQVKFRCGDQDPVMLNLTIATGRPDSTPSPVPQGVRAGIGGSAGGLDLQEVALGGALIAGALGTAYLVARRRTGDKRA